MRDIDVLGYEAVFFPEIIKIKGENENEFLLIPTCEESLGIISEILPATKSDRLWSLWHNKSEDEFETEDKAKYYFYKPAGLSQFANSRRWQVGAGILLLFFMAALFPSNIKYVIATWILLVLVWTYLKKSHHLFNEYEDRMCYFRPNKEEMVIVNHLYQKVTFFNIEDVDEFTKLVPDEHGDVSLLRPRNHRGIPTYYFDKDDRVTTYTKRLEHEKSYLENELSRLSKITEQPREIIRRPPIEEE